jgi:4-amino-4-deoxy-L-arabinose transferase-like glycosyltransferase
MREAMPAGIANALALVVTAVGNTAANRWLTFGVHGRRGLARDHAAGLLALGAALFHHVGVAGGAERDQTASRSTDRDRDPGRLANAAATLVRFLLLRLAIDRADGARMSTPAPPNPLATLSNSRKGHEDDRHRQTRLLPRIRPVEGLSRNLVRGSTDEAVWVRPAFVGVLALAAVLYLWNLTVSGYANTYYSAAALAGSQSWSAWFFGSFDANNFITVDKPPLGTMLMGLSVRLFGLSSWSILLPEALCRRGHGRRAVPGREAVLRAAAAATIAAIVMALTPAAVLIFRFNNPDALLTLLLVLSAWALLRSLEHGSFRWMALAATCVGLAFLTKYLQAYLVLPGYALVFGFSANTTLRRRIVGLVARVRDGLVTSGWWVAIVELLPAGSKPFIGGSTTGSPLDLILGYDGLGRIFGSSGRAGRRFGGAGFGFSGDVGPLRLFNDQLFGQIAWLIPLAIVCLVVGLFRRRWAHRTDLAFAGYLLWGSWFVVTAIVFSYMSGIIHSYYAVALGPAIAALVGAGWSTCGGSRAADLVRRDRRWRRLPRPRPGSAQRNSTGRRL